MENPVPLITVVLPTYNRTGSLSKSIQSVLDQTYTNFELLVIDDASTDNTREVVSRIDDPRIKYIEHEVNQGPSVARNTGIEKANGNIIAFQDSDDEWFPEKLQKQVSAFDTAPSDVGVVYTGMWRIVNDERRYIPYTGVAPKEGDISSSIMRFNFISTQMAAVQKKCFDEVGKFDEKLDALTDWELWIRIANHYRFKLVNEPLVSAVVQSDSISQDNDKILEAREHIVNKHYDKFDSKALARNLFYIGHGSMKTGQVRNGRDYLGKAVRTKPHPVYLGAWCLSFVGAGAYRGIYTVFKKLNRNALLDGGAEIRPTG